MSRGKGDASAGLAPAIAFGACGILLRSGGFTGPAILEIGGLPRSGGYGRDTYTARVTSLRRLRAARA